MSRPRLDSPALPFDEWLRDLQKRHGSELTFSEIRRALSALSSLYTARRKKIRTSVFDGAGKRAAFALFYGPLHFIVLTHIIKNLHAATGTLTGVLDLGCGSAVAGAAWAAADDSKPVLSGVDRNRWVVGEARHTLRALGVRGRVHVGELLGTRLPGRGHGIVAAYTINELDDPGRDTILTGLLSAHAKGARVLIVEPIAKGPAPWWKRWAEVFEKAGGRADEWRFKPDLPQILRDLSKAAGLNHRELTGRSLYLPELKPSAPEPR